MLLLLFSELYSRCQEYGTERHLYNMFITVYICHVSYFNTLRETRPSGPRDIKRFFLQITGDPSLDAGCNCNIKFPIRFDMHVQDMRRYIDG